MTDLYFAFAAGLAAGVVLTVGALTVLALRKLPEEPPRYRQYQD